MKNTRAFILLFIKPFWVGIILTSCSLWAGQDKNAFDVVIECRTDKDLYKPKDSIEIVTLIKNKTRMSATFSNIKIQLRQLTSSPDGTSVSYEVVDKITVKAGGDFNVKRRFKLPPGISEGVFGIYFLFQKNEQETISYQTFFRVSEKDVLTVYKIDQFDYKGLNVFALDGGMSAEYAVEKSAAVLSAGISHSWYVNAPGSGPNHVYSSPDFLAKSITQTVNFYDGLLGTNTTLETVIIGPGIPSVPYLSLSMKAPVLPIHYLVSVNTVKEVRTILQHSTEAGYSAYATLSHDPSVSLAVAWIKLLDLPSPYLDFIKRHNVKNVVLIGSTGVNEGETKSKQILEDIDNFTPEDYDRESLYIMYPGTSDDDVKTLEEKIPDLKEFIQGDFKRIADWESGINQVQIQNTKKILEDRSVRNLTSVSVISANDLIHLYDLGSILSLALIRKNRTLYDEGRPLTGVMLNPYLICHPLYELRFGFIPLFYWQGIPAPLTVGRVEKQLREAVKKHFPEVDFNELLFIINCTRNFGAESSSADMLKELHNAGLDKVLEGDYTVDEVWKLNDTDISPVEERAELILKYWSPEDYHAWYAQIIPLTIHDIKALSAESNSIDVEVEVR